MKRIVLLSAVLLAVAPRPVVAAPFQFFQTSHNVAVFSNATSENFFGLHVVFADEVEPLREVAIGALLERSEASASELVYRGSIPPHGGLEINWDVDGPRVLAAYWIRADSEEIEIDIHSPTARMLFSAPRGTDDCCDEGTCMRLTPVEVGFSSTGSADPDGLPLVLYEWTWSDGLRMEGFHVKRLFTQPGEYAVQLVVWDAEGLMDAETRSFHIPRYSCIPD